MISLIEIITQKGVILGINKAKYIILVLQLALISKGNDLLRVLLSLY